MLWHDQCSYKLCHARSAEPIRWMFAFHVSVNICHYMVTLHVAWTWGMISWFIAKCEANTTLVTCSIYIHKEFCTVWPQKMAINLSVATAMSYDLTGRVFHAQRLEQNLMFICVPYFLVGLLLLELDVHLKPKILLEWLWNHHGGHLAAITKYDLCGLFMFFFYA